MCQAPSVPNAACKCAHSLTAWCRSSGRRLCCRMCVTGWLQCLAGAPGPSLPTSLLAPWWRMPLGCTEMCPKPWLESPVWTTRTMLDCNYRWNTPHIHRKDVICSATGDGTYDTPLAGDKPGTPASGWGVAGHVMTGCLASSCNSAAHVFNTFSGMSLSISAIFSLSQSQSQSQSQSVFVIVIDIVIVIVIVIGNGDSIDEQERKKGVLKKSDILSSMHCGLGRQRRRQNG